MTKARTNWTLAALVAILATPIALLAALAEPPPQKAPASIPGPSDLTPGPEPTEGLAAPIQPDATRYGDPVLYQARLTTNEAGLGSARHPTIDGPLIGWIVARNADVNGMSLVDWIEHAHPRHLRPDRTDGNRWVASLAEDLQRPDGWPEARIPWDTDPRGRARWQGRLDEAAAYQRGEIDLTCPAAYPRIWGGPYVDRCFLLTKLSARTHRVVAGPPIAPCAIRNAAGEVVQILTEQPWMRVESEACYVTDEGGDLLMDSRNVYLARVADLEGR